MKEKKGDANKKLFEELNNNINKYVEVFAKKHDFYFNEWVDDVVGHLGCFSDEYYFDFETIKLDLEKDVPKELLLKWYDRELEKHNQGKEETSYYHYLRSKK